MSEERRTEARNPRAAALASFGTREILELMNDEDGRVPAAVRAAIPEIARAVDTIVASFASGGRLRYVGAGTSGRLGVLDASEAPPTFGVEPELVRGIIAGGDAALRGAIEGAEDDDAAGARDVRAWVRPGDVVVGISASGRARYAVAALVAAREVGARTVALTCDPAAPLAAAADIAVALDVGPEVLAGSSRLKAGTATKLVLNMLTTASMVRSGRTKGDLMIDLRAANAKLRERAIRIVRDETGAGEDAARAALDANGWSARAAIDALEKRARP
ncbi:MAG TPA: N-acetylmuramic acid 6-phosphate etherase [Candidatus Limnocylindria bacterium]|nr:N-acetylmuramic acid 6-phosphate etherase [Candidatus Limnocylindria bacterium]